MNVRLPLLGLLAAISWGGWQEICSAQDKPAAAKPAATEAAPAKTAEATPAAKPEDPKADDAKPADAAAPAGEAKPFDKLFAEWKTLIGRLRKLQEEYKIAMPDAQPALEKEFTDLVAQGEKMAPVLKQEAEVAFAANPTGDKNISEFLSAIAMGEQRSDNFEEAARLGKLLLTNKIETKGLLEMTGNSCFEIADFDNAEKYLNEAKAKGELGQQGQGYLTEIPTYREYWKKEQEIRAAEANADDLPRILFKTSKGDITIELFENEAPNATANMIDLVSKGFYNGLTFHRVLPGFMAQGGDPKGDGSGGPGYNIPCECFQENHRIHFRGSLSMAHAGKDTGGSQFFLTFRPTGHLNGKHTVFGRVIEGLDVLNRLQRRDPETPGGPAPDKIIEAKVLRKRDHEYKVVKVGEPEVKTEPKEEKK